MEKAVYSFKELFSGRLFFVPDYQRGYAWEHEHCNDLLEDVELLPEGRDHYTGTIVLNKLEGKEADAEGTSFAKVAIVDGQQRLTSTVILLSVIHKIFEAEASKKNLAMGIEKNYLKTSRLEDNLPIYRLTLIPDCADYFREEILGTGSVAGATIMSHERLLNAQKTFSDYFQLQQELRKDDFLEWLQTYFFKIVDQLKVGIYEVTSSAEVGMIFEAMNNRGKGLTELEKVKNYLLYLATKVQQGEGNELGNLINKTWSNIYHRFMAAELGSDYEDQFFRAHWLMYKDAERKNWNGSKSVKGQYNLKIYAGNYPQLFTNLMNYVKSLDEASIAYVDLEKPTNGFNAFVKHTELLDIRIWSTKLQRLNVLANFIPLMMACRLRYPSDAAKYLELLKMIEVMSFRMFKMGGKRADAGQSNLNRQAFDLLHHHRDFDAIMNGLKGVLEWYHPFHSFNGFWDFNALDNDWYHWGGLRYFLYEYEEMITAGKGVAVTWDTLQGRELSNSIEHILPQTMEDIENYWPTKFTKEEHDLHVHDLGNLCLTYDNSSYRNFSFTRKKGSVSQEKACYAKSSLRQERDLTQHADWDVATIGARRAILVNWAKERWGVDIGNAAAVPAVDLDD